MRTIRRLLLGPICLVVAAAPGPAGAQILSSGLYPDGSRQFLLTQGLTGYTFVSGKETLFRAFIPKGWLDQVVRMQVNVSFSTRGPGSGPTYVALLERKDLILETAAPAGPSAGLIIPGYAMPIEGTYDIAAIVTFQPPHRPRAMNFTARQVTAHRAVDLRLLVIQMFGEGWYYPDSAWHQEIVSSLRKLATMLPVRDNVDSVLTPVATAGLRFALGNHCDGSARSVISFYRCAYEQTKYLIENDGNPVDVTVEWRPGFYPERFPVDPPDPNPGGNAGPPPAPYGQYRRAACVSGDYLGRNYTAACLGQEIGHNYGLVQAGSPHSDVAGNDAIHSKDPIIDDPLAFDFFNRRPFTQLDDVMSNNASGSFRGVWAGSASAMFRAEDWEVIRTTAISQSGGKTTGTRENPYIVPLTVVIPPPP